MKDSGYAFPRESSIGHFGMTLRDYFAGQALLGLISFYGNDGKSIGSVAYALADAMLEERAKTTV
jgi:hypothetical protein